MLQGDLSSSNLCMVKSLVQDLKFLVWSCISDWGTYVKHTITGRTGAGRGLFCLLGLPWWEGSLPLKTTHSRGHPRWGFYQLLMYLLTLFGDYIQGFGYLSFSNHWKISKHIVVVCIHFLNPFKQQDIILAFVRGYIQLMLTSSFRTNKQIERGSEPKIAECLLLCPVPFMSIFSSCSGLVHGLNRTNHQGHFDSNISMDVLDRNKISYKYKDLLA